MSQNEQNVIDAYWMRQALAAARVAATEYGEVPIGACLVSGVNNQLLAVAGNRTRTDCDPTAHAEMIVIREAAQRIGNYRLTDAVLYATLEPCAMCAGALIQARIKRLVYAAPDERAGAIESVFRICDTSSLNHQIESTANVLEAESRKLLRDFFRTRRETKVGRRRAKGESVDKAGRL